MLPFQLQKHLKIKQLQLYGQKMENNAWPKRILNWYLPAKIGEEEQTTSISKKRNIYNIMEDKGLKPDD